jgi:ElaB/YqjD/DUF883 family membrane-anchored ribosome-binding protein
MAQPLRTNDAEVTAPEASVDAGVMPQNDSYSQTGSDGQAVLPATVPAAALPARTDYGLVGALGSEEAKPESGVERTRQIALDAFERLKVRSTRAKNRAADILANAREASGQWTRSARTRAREVCDERPLQVLAGVAGAAFVAGVLLRFWRSSRYE